MSRSRSSQPHPSARRWVAVLVGLLVALGACGEDSALTVGGVELRSSATSGAVSSDGTAAAGAGTAADPLIGDGASVSATGPGPAGEPADGMTVVPESLSWSPDSTSLAFGTREGRFYIGAGPDFEPVAGAALGPSSRPFARWSPAGDKVLLGGAWFDAGQVNTGLWIYAPASGQIDELVPPSQVVSSVGGNTGAVHDAQWSPDGTRIAFPYRGEAWLAAPGELPERLTQLTDQPLSREGAVPFDGVRYVYWDPSGERLALELSCDCGTPWSGTAVFSVGGDSSVGSNSSAGGGSPSGRSGSANPVGTPVETSALTLVRDGLALSGWSPDGRVLGQNVADWSPDAVVDGYAVSPADGAAENLTRSVEGRDPLFETSPETDGSLPGAPTEQTAPGAPPGSAGAGQPASGSGQGAAGAGQPASGSGQGVAGAGQPASGSGQGVAGAAPLFQTGPVQWGRDGTLLYETYTYADHPVPHRGFVVRRAGATMEERLGSPMAWFTAPRLLPGGTVAYVESGPGPVMPLMRAMIGDQEIAALDGLASAVSFSPDARRLAIVEGSLNGGGGAVKVIELPVR